MSEYLDLFQTEQGLKKPGTQTPASPLPSLAFDAALSTVSSPDFLWTS